MNPYLHFCLDIETTDGEPTEAERIARLEWSPASNWKPETIGNRWIETVAKKKEKLALIHSAPIISFAVKTDRDLLCLHSMHPQLPTQVGSGQVAGFATERQMLAALRDIMNSCCNEQTLLIGHNIIRFDLPKLRNAYIRNGLCLPVALTDNQPLFDNMVQYARAFRGSDDGIFISAADLMDNFQIKHHKGMVEGGDVPHLFKAGKFDEIIAYNLLDAAKEYETFCRMTGNHPDDPDPINGTPSPLAATLRLSIAEELAKQLAEAADLGAVARVFTKVFSARKELGETDYLRLTGAVERREAELTPATAGANF